MYNILLRLSRNLFFYKNIKLPDTFETRIYLMFVHFSILMIITKNKDLKFNQNIYDQLFHNIENNLREIGLGDVTVNKKMKELNKILYDILLKLNLENDKKFKINLNLIKKYFSSLNEEENKKLGQFADYFTKFYNFCFELPMDNMLEDAIKFKY